MSKFKVGDLVTPSKPSGHLTKGEAYAVIGFSAHCFLVIDDGGCKIFCIDDACAHGGTWTHYGQTLAELNVKAGDVVERVQFDGRDISRLSNHHNATLRGQTRDGKPVGQWVIDMDAD